MAIKVYSPTDFEDTSSGVSIDGNLVVNTSVLYVDTANDRVGIGTTSPYGRLELSGSGQSWNTAPAIRMWDSFNSKGWLVGNVNNITAGDFYIRTLPSVNGNPSTGQQEFTIKHTTGNVGIGTSSPTTHLHLKGHGSGDGEIRIDSSASNASFGIFRFQGDSSTYEKYLIAYNSAHGTQANELSLKNTAGNITFHAGTGGTTAERVRITSTGNLGIGATSPLRKLHVVGDLAINAGTGQYYGVYINGVGEGANPNILIGDWHNASANITWDSTNRLLRIDAQYSTNGAPIVFSGNDAATEYARFTASGNVGIGTTSPYSLLQVGDPEQTTPAELTIASRYDGGGPILNFRTDHPNNAYQWNTARIRSTDDGNYNGRLEFQTTVNSGYLGTQPQTRMVIKATGNVGIGNTSPSTKLSVNGNLQVYAGGTWASSGGGLQLTSDGTDGFVTHYYDNQSVTIGAGVSQKNNIRISGHTADNNITFRVGNSERMRITTDGNVGIGTTSPGEKLHISGNVRVGSGSHYNAINFVRNGGSGVGAIGWHSDDVFYVAGHPSHGPTAGNVVRVYGFGSDVRLGDSTNGDVLTVDASNGNVGIGTTIPSHKLQVVGTSHFSGRMLINSTNTNSNKNDFAVGTNGDPQISLYSDQVQIGGTDMNWNAKWYYSSGVSHIGTWDGNFRIFTQGGSGSTAKDITFAPQTTGGSSIERMRIRGSDGNVGIGTTSPSYPLEVAGTSTVSLAYQRTGVAAKKWGFHSDNSNTYWQNLTDNILAFTLSNAGNVGIGTTSPSQKLEVNGNALVSNLYLGGNSFTRLSSDGSGEVGINYNNSATTTYGFSVYNGATSRVFGVLRATGATIVGSSTHRGGKLQVNDYNSNDDGIRIYGYSDNEMLSLISRYDQANGGLFFKRGANGSESTIGEINWTSNQFRINAEIGSLALMTGGSTSVSINSNQVVSLSAGLNVTAGSINMGTNIITDTKVGQWDTAYSWGDHSTQSYATQTYVNTAVSNLVDSAPSTLDTLNELAAALGDDPNFATTVTNSIATKLPLSGGTMTGIINTNSNISFSQDSTGVEFYSVNSLKKVAGRGMVLEVDTSRAASSYLEILQSGTYYFFWNSNQFSITDVSNWNTAYSWGDHSGQYLPINGGTVGGAVTINGPLVVNGTITENSSLRVKENIITSEGHLNKINKLRPVKYNKIDSEKTEIGLIAEEVVEVYPEFIQYDENGEPAGIHYSRLTAALIGAVKELNNRLEKLENK